MTEPFELSKEDITAIAISYDELVSYLDTVGDEGQLDDEEMPSGKLTWTVKQLRSLLDRYAKYESVMFEFAHSHHTLEVPTVRATIRPTPPSGPKP